MHIKKSQLGELRNSVLYLLVSSLVLVWSIPVVLAEDEEVSSSTAVDVDEEVVELVYPYTKTFVISAYYSPLPGQEHYATGSYDGDIRLNGRGTNGADGTEVNIHMFAAPRTFAFGTKLTCPGIGTGTVHDRGGAIKGSRLDKWMGYGDVGLKRALQYGKRTVTCIVHGVDPSIPEVSYIDDFSEAEKFIQGVFNTPMMFTQDLWYGATGEDVEKLQKHLETLGYYHDEINAKYGDTLREAVFEFQKAYGILDNEEELGAGVFGPQTRVKLEAIIEKRGKEKLPTKKLNKGNSGEDVEKLQEALKRLGYDVEVTGEFDEATEDAVFRFQLDNDLLESEDDTAAGYFGSSTLASLTYSVINQSIVKNEVEQNEIPNGVVLLSSELNPGDQGAEVYKLQEELIRLNFLRIEPTGFYGKYTEHAVFKFQQSNNLVVTKDSPGAGSFDPMTRDTLNNFVATRVETKRLIATKNGRDDAPTILVFHSNLSPGSKNENVEDLQQGLKELGYFDYQFVTDYYGAVTRSAVIAFQKDHGIISSESDQGAGVFGPQTRLKLSEVLRG